MYIRKQFNPQFTLHRFSMIDVTLAMVIGIIATVAIMLLFPASMTATQSAMGTSYANDVAQQFLNFNASQINKDWSWTERFPAEKSSIDDSTFTWSENLIPNGDHVVIRFPKSDAESGESNDKTGVFLLEQMGSDANASSFSEFTAVLRTWKRVQQLQGDAEMLTLNVEVSWPAAQKYETRNSKIFSIEVFKAEPDALPIAESSPLDIVNIAQDACDQGLSININPSHANQNMFEIVTPSGTYTSDNLMHNSADRIVEYDGKASSIFLRAKANGNSFLFNGSEYNLGNNDTVLIEGKLDVNLYNVHQNHPDTANAMGHWYICITAKDATIDHNAQPFM